jgi:hypothetical protein
MSKQMRDLDERQSQNTGIFSIPYLKINLNIKNP